MGIAVLLAAAAIAASPASYVQSRQQTDGGFAEAGGVPGPELTAWAALGLRAGGAETGNALSYLVAHERELSSPTSIALVALAEGALVCWHGCRRARGRSTRRSGTSSPCDRPIVPCRGPSSPTS
jgi:hypothetical protein